MPILTNTLNVPSEVLAHIIGFLDIKNSSQVPVDTLEDADISDVANSDGLRQLFSGELTTKITSLLQFRRVSRSFNDAVMDYPLLETKAGANFPAVNSARSYSVSDLFSHPDNKLVAFKMLFAITNGKRKVNVQSSDTGSSLSSKIAPITSSEIDLTGFTEKDGKINFREVLAKLKNHIASSTDKNNRQTYKTCLIVSALTFALLSAAMVCIIVLVIISKLLHTTYPSAIALDCHMTKGFHDAYMHCEKEARCNSNHSVAFPFNLTELCGLLLCSSDGDIYQPVNSTELFAVCNDTNTSLFVCLGTVTTFCLVIGLITLYNCVSRDRKDVITYIPSDKSDENQIFTLCGNASTFFKRRLRAEKKSSRDTGLANDLLERGYYGTIIDNDPRAEG